MKRKKPIANVDALDLFMNKISIFYGIIISRTNFRLTSKSKFAITDNTVVFSVVPYERRNYFHYTHLNWPMNRLAN